MTGDRPPRPAVGESRNHAGPPEPPALPTDSQLQALFRQHQTSGWTEATFQPLYSRYRPRVLSHMRRFVDEEIARELAQEVFVNLFDSAATFGSVPSFEGFLAGITGNVLKNYWRSTGTQKRKGQEEPIETLQAQPALEKKAIETLGPRADDPLAEAIRNENRQRVKHALAELPTRMRAVAMLRYAQERTYEEIATILDVSINTVKSQLFEARKRLIEKLRGMDDDLDPAAGS